MPRREDRYLADILTACRHVATFLEGKSLEDWIDDELLQFGVLQRLTVIGEAARRLDPAVRNQYPEVPWRDLTAPRNLAVHDYFAVEWPLVWTIAREDVPRLGEQFRAILAADYPLVLALLDAD
jgi:uncharacterized protein with HEPN domain